MCFETEVAKLTEVSVVMSAYNDEQYVGYAIESILKQTYSDFEFIIVNDGSTDHTAEVIQSYNDPRIRFFNLSENKGLATALNCGIQKAIGKYIVRQDSDDLSHQDRLEKLITFIKSNREYALVGSKLRTFFDDDNTIVREKAARQELWFNRFSGDILLDQMLMGNQIINGTVIYLKSAFDRLGGYNDEYECTQDYDLHLRLLETGKLFKLDEVLYDYRIHPKQVSISKYRIQKHYNCLAKTDWFLRHYNPADYRRFFIWGAGDGGRFLHSALTRRQIDIVSFMDINPEKLAQEIEGKKVIHPDQIVFEKGDFIFGASSVGREEIEKTLTERGLKKYQDFVSLW